MNRQLRLSQQDTRWYHTKIGKSNSILGNVGCAITSLAMAINKLNHGVQMTPDVLAKELTFVPLPGDPDPRGLSWTGSKDALAKYGVEFVWRGQGMDENLKLLCQSETNAVIIQVKNNVGGQHWLYLWNWGILGPIGWDPWDGTVVRKVAGLMGKYPEITGWCQIRKI